MLSMKSVASALVLAATAADFAAPVLVAPALALGASALARVETPAEIRQDVASYRDPNLAAPLGGAALQARLKVAAEIVCAPGARRRNFADAADYDACVAKAIRVGRADAA